jgi:hypothetical protein
MAEIDRISRPRFGLGNMKRERRPVGTLWTDGHPLSFASGTQDPAGVLIAGAA